MKQTIKKALRALGSVTLSMALIMPASLPVFANSTVGTEITSETSTLSNGNYYLNDDVTLNSSLSLSSGDVEINLNGHQLRLSNGAGNWKSVVYVSGGNLVINGDNGTISGGTGGHNQRGGGFHIDGGNVTVNDVNITENNAAWGGGVFINTGNGTFTMNNSHIVSNTSISDGNGWNDGGGVYLDGGTFTINGGSITKNNVTGGKKNGALIANHATFNISGDVVIYDNKDGETQENLFADAIFTGSGSFNVTGPLGPNTKIGVTSAFNQVFTSSENTDYNDPTKFVSDSSSYKVDKNENGQLMLVDVKNILCTATGFEGTYDGKEHGISVDVTDPAEGATVKYGLSAEECTMNQSPTFKNAGDTPVQVFYKIEAYNHNDKIGSATVTINKADSEISKNPVAKELTYNGSEQKLADEGNANGGTMQYAVSEDKENAPTEGWADTVPSAAKPGTYYVWYKVVGDENHNDTEPEVLSCQISKIDSSVSVKPEAKELTDTDKEQELIKAGTPDGGVMQYAIGDNGETAPTDGWSETVPAASKPGTYYVWYKVVGDENHNESKAEVITCKIRERITREVTFKVVNGSWNDGTSKDVTVSLTGSDEDVLKLSSDQIPSVGNKADSDYEKGSWNAEPNTSEEVKEDITYIYTYKKKASVPTKPVAQKNAVKNISLKGTQTGSKVTLKWGRISGATSYRIYGSYCGKKMKLQKTVSGKSAKLTLRKLNGKKLNLKKHYKFRIFAYKKAGNKTTQIGKSLDIHIAGKKNKKHTNVKSVIVSKTSYNLNKNGTAKINAKLVLKDKKKKALGKEHGKRFRYISSNPTIATVNSNGIIQAKKSGKCTVSVFAINGCEKKITVTVK